MNDPRLIPHTGGPGDTIVVLPLDIFGEGVSAEHAAVADCLKYGMKFKGAFDINDPTVGCGIYWTDNGFISKTVAELATPPPPATRSVDERTARSVEPVRTYQSFEAPRVEQARLVPPLSSGPSTPGHRNPTYNPYSSARPLLSPEFAVASLGLDPPGDVAAYGYTLELVLDNLHERGPPETFVRQTTSPGEDAEDQIYRLAVDTGGWVDSWIFGALKWDEFRYLGSEDFHGSPYWKGLFDAKSKIGHPPRPAVQNDIATFEYGYPGVAGEHMSVRVEQTLVHVYCGDYQKKKTALYAEKFLIGSVQSCDSAALIRQADGLLALGRWINATEYTRFHASGTWTASATTLVGAMYNAKRIQHERFYVRISHPGLESPGASFMCFGKFRDVTRVAEPRGCIQQGCAWSDINCSYVRTSQHPTWMVWLERITIQSPGIPDVVVTVRMRFVLDTGAAHSYVPSDMLKKIQEYLRSVQGDEAGQASNIPEAATIVFTFGDKDPLGDYTLVNVTGQAIRFLANPLASIAGQGNAACVKSVPDGHTMNLLGLNFFRTFCVGFVDHGLYPWVSFAPQRHLVHRS